MKLMKIVGIVILQIVVVALIALGIFWYRNTHWFDKYEKALDRWQIMRTSTMISIPMNRYR